MSTPAPSPTVVITSISAPTAAVRAFADRVGDRLIVVGDRKTPADWSLPPVTYLGPDTHGVTAPRLSAALPWNHYCRKVIGYVHAARAGATAIYDTDDDNAPLAHWAVPPFDGTYGHTADDLGYVNAYRWFSDQPIWPRGLPLRHVRTSWTPAPLLDAAPHRVGVWQNLADVDPDVDAIYRLIDGTPCTFRPGPPVVLGRGTVCPFNSQATAFDRACFPLLYLPSTVATRVTDILRGLVAQPILWAAGLRLGFTRATVVQERNPHDLLRDFAEEVPLYLHAETMVDTAIAAVRTEASISDNLYRVYDALAQRSLVTAEEPARVEAWLRDLAD